MKCSIFYAIILSILILIYISLILYIYTMLGISISELAIVCISAILLLERSEMQYAIRSIVNAIYKMKKSLHEAQKRCISELNIEMQNNQKDNKYYIMSSDGKKYEAYDMPNHNLKKIASNDAQKQ